MRRNVRLEDISDGKLYTAQDMVRADCRGCDGRVGASCGRRGHEGKGQGLSGTC